MAGRIRTIKPEMFDDERFARMSAEARCVFFWGITEADDHGNLRANPALIASKVFWACPILGGRTIDDVVAELADVWTFYSVRGQQYAHINGWHKHQRIDNATAPRVPMPPGWAFEEVVKVSGSRTRKHYVSRRVDSDTLDEKPVPRGAVAKHVNIVPVTAATVATFTGNDSPEFFPPDHRSPITDQRPPTTEAAEQLRVTEEEDGIVEFDDDRDSEPPSPIVPAPPAMPSVHRSEHHVATLAKRLAHPRVLALFPGMDLGAENALTDWASELVDCATAISLPNDVEIIPHATYALRNLSDAVRARPAMPLKERLTYLRRTFESVLARDKGHGWKSGRSNGKEGPCAPVGERAPAPANRHQDNTGLTDVEHELREMAKTEALRIESDRSRARLVSPANLAPAKLDARRPLDFALTHPVVPDTKTRPSGGSGQSGGISGAGA